MERASLKSNISSARPLQVTQVIGPEVYFMGIIDYQQQWTIGKQVINYFNFISFIIYY
jgi:hypothetical protein